MDTQLHQAIDFMGNRALSEHDLTIRQTEVEARRGRRLSLRALAAHRR